MPMTDYGGVLPRAMPTHDVAGNTKQKKPRVVPPGVDYGDGVPIPPMGPPPGANQGGGPGIPQSDMRSGIFQSLYEQGRQGGNMQMMDMMAPPLDETGMPPLPDTAGMPGFPPAPDQFAGLSLPPTQPPPRAEWPIHLGYGPSGMQPQRPISRFPRAQSLMSGANRAVPQRPRQGY